MRMTALVEDAIAGFSSLALNHRFPSGERCWVQVGASCISRHGSASYQGSPSWSSSSDSISWGRASRSDRSANEEADEEVVGRTPGPVLDGPQAARGKDEV